MACDLAASVFVDSYTGLEFGRANRASRRILPDEPVGHPTGDLVQGNDLSTDDIHRRSGERSGALANDLRDAGTVREFLHVDSIEECVDIDSVHECVHVDSIEECVDIDPVHECIDVDVVENDLGIHSVEECVDVDPVHQCVDVDLIDDRVGIDDVDDRTGGFREDPREQPVAVRLLVGGRFLIVRHRCAPMTGSETERRGSCMGRRYHASGGRKEWGWGVEPRLQPFVVAQLLVGDGIENVHLRCLP